MEKIYIGLLIIGISLISALSAYLFSLPSGQAFSNGILINIPGNRVTNIGLNGSYFINVKNLPAMYFFNSTTTTYSLNNYAIKIYPFNDNYYTVSMLNKTVITPINNHNISLDLFNSTIYLLKYDNATSYTYLVNYTIGNITSVYSSNNSKILIYYKKTLKSYPITLNYTQNAHYFQNITVGCYSGSNRMIITTNNGANKSFNTGDGTINTTAHPYLKVSCYNGYNYITNMLNFSKIPANPINFSYNAGIAKCRSIQNSSIFLYLNGKIVDFSTASLSYAVNIKPPFILRCYIPGNLYQESVNKTISVS